MLLCFSVILFMFFFISIDEEVIKIIELVSLLVKILF